MAPQLLVEPGQEVVLVVDLQRLVQLRLAVERLVMRFSGLWAARDLQAGLANGDDVLILEQRLLDARALTKVPLVLPRSRSRNC